MVKKVIMAVTSVCAAGVIFLSSGVDAKAALPCTYDIINDANAQIAYYDQNYNAAKACEAELLATFNAVKNNPAHSQLEYEQAAYNYTNAVNKTKWWLTGLNNAKAYLKNISDRGAFEDKFAANKAALADLTTLQAAKTDADGYVNIANGVAAQIADAERAIAGYQAQLAACPSLQAQIDALNVRLAALKADYAAKAAVASEKRAVFDNYLNTLNYKAYSLGFEDYQFNREYQRDNVDWDPKIYNY